MKGHTGAMLSLGKGGIYSGSWKQRLVARSSTESELIGVYDVLPQILWTKKISGGTGVERFGQHRLPRQYQLNPTGKKWTKFEYEMNKTHEHYILLCYQAS